MSSTRTSNARVRAIPLARPHVTEAEIGAVCDVLRSAQLSLGPRLAEFEAAFASYCRTRHAVACSSGTAALHMLIRAMGIGPGDEAITTPFSFIASSNCILMEGATPVFADIEPRTWNIDVQQVEAAITPRTRAILAVDVFGQVAEMASLRRIASRHKLRLIEDSCEALGARYQGKSAGSLGDAGVFGFYPNKQITTGEGGMIVTDDTDLADLCRSLRNQGREPTGGWLAHPRLGYNYRLSEINCALGLAQLSRIDEILDERRRVASLYRRHLANESRLLHQQEIADSEKSWFVFVARLSDEYTQKDRDRILRALGERGIGCGNYFAPIHLQPFYVERFGYRLGSFPVCEAVSARTIALPFHHELDEEDVAWICDELRKLL